MAALNIRWDTVSKIVNRRNVISGMDAPDPTEVPESPFHELHRKYDMPIVVFVYGAASADDDFEKIERVVFKNEKVGLGMKAFKTLKITPDDANLDLLIADRGKSVPRLLLIDPVKEKVRVLEANKIKVSALYSAMKGLAKSFYKDSLDSTVKAHLKLLNERDKLHNEKKNLQTKLDRLAEEDTARSRKEAEKIGEEMQALDQEIEKVAVEERELWNMQRRHPLPEKADLALRN